MTVLTADGKGGTYWAIPSTLGYNPSFNQIVTDAATFTANLRYNTLTLSEGGGIGFVQGAGTNQLYIYSKGFNQLNVAGGNSLYGFSSNITKPALNFVGAGGISLQANPETNTLTFTANGQPISTSLNSFQSLKVFPNLSTPTRQVSSLSGYSVLSANNYSSILTLAGTGQISLTSDYNANAVFIGLNTSTLVTSNLTTQIVSTASIYASTLTLIDLVGGNPKSLYSYNGSLFLNGVVISGGSGAVTQIYGGSNIVLTGATPGLGDVTVNVNTSFLPSTVIGLGTVGYISTSVLPGGLVSTANLANLISTSFFNKQINSLSVGILCASTFINDNIHILAGSKLILTSTVGINCNTPAYTLDVNGNINANTGYFLNGGVFTSDRRIKTNIVNANLETCYSTVRDLSLHRFEYTSSFRQLKNDVKQIGFIADEVETVFPKSIYTAPVNRDGLSTLKFVNFEQIQMAHFGATQYMASLLEQQNSTIVGQNASIGSLQLDILNLSTTLGLFMSR
jgi:hypothetical protein